ncbi:unnamed protein product [Penicillium roqueforti FM164]|uniref:Genomic scaffold, ProqFM164S02 n=1 Tax=Penicillium roqueforti (strain FM164) TaxID=1365484 RepID=W6Q7W4_PENRF|nr:unnamed protein product [Penicillium roqueforti FM164]
MGQRRSTDNPRDGICGSAICNEDGNVFRYAPTSDQFLNWRLFARPECLIGRGFNVAE